MWLVLPPPPPIDVAFEDWRRPPLAIQEVDESVTDGPPVERGEDASDFVPGVLEIKLRTAFNGYSQGPLSLLGALIGWTEFQLCADVGVVQISELTVGLGAEAFYSRPWFLEVFTEALGNLLLGDNGEFDWKAVNKGFAVRGTLHYTGLSALDPYGLFLAGPYRHDVEVSATFADGSGGEASHSTWGMKYGLGGGVASAARSGIMGGVELRYLVGHRFRATDSIVVTSPDGTETQVFEMTGYVKPPRGFSWVVYLGFRI